MTHSVSLTLGSAIVYVAGTVNSVPVTWTLAEGNRWCAAVERVESGLYAVEFSAYDEAGNRADYAITLEYGLHYKLDWTSRDYLNAADLNRLERNIFVLADLIKLHGCNVNLQTKVDWEQTDILRRGDIDRIRSNIDALQNAFARLPDWREILYEETVDAEQVNAWEWDLRAVSIWVERMVASFIYCGEIYTGDD